jgi:ABC-type antimicrobial peptide transport system permease subunit
LVKQPGRIAIALPLGWLLAWLARHAIAQLLYSVAPDGPATFAAAGAIVSIIGCLAALHPALRAARTDPATALRQE